MLEHLNRGLRLGKYFEALARRFCGACEVSSARAQRRLISDLVNLYLSNRDEVALALDQLRGQILADKELGKYIHSVKWRIKDPEHLRGSLKRKIKYAREVQQFEITKENFFREFNDLAGIRIIHLHTQQMEELDKALKHRLDEALHLSWRAFGTYLG